MSKGKGKKLSDLIKVIADSMAKALAEGKSIDQAIQCGREEAQAKFAHERIYVPGQPKAKTIRAVQLAQMEKRTTQQIVAVTGLSRQHVWRLRKLTK